jgi:hypothetical protein
MMRTEMEGVLHARQLIPPITARTVDGKQVHAWDYKQRRNLVIAFLHADCAPCNAWLADLAACAPKLDEHEAVALVVYSELPPRSAPPLPSPVVAATDSAGRSQIAFLGREAFGSAGLERVGVFVTDRYGELYENWVGNDATELPGTGRVLSALWQIQIACEECGTTHWPFEA